MGEGTLHTARMRRLLALLAEGPASPDELPRLAAAALLDPVRLSPGEVAMLADVLARRVGAWAAGLAPEPPEEERTV